MMINQDLTYVFKTQSIIDALSTMPESPAEITACFQDSKPIASKKTYEILDEILNWVEHANSDPKELGENDIVISGNALLSNLAYV